MFDLQYGSVYVECRKPGAGAGLASGGAGSKKAARAFEPRLKLHWLTRATQVLSGRLLGLLLCTYLLAAFLPVGGGNVRLAEFRLLGEPCRVSLSMGLLGLLLLGVGLEIPLAQVGKLLRNPTALLAGLAANLVVPLAYIAALSCLLKGHADPYALHCLLIGLALVAAMPVAGSSVAWTHAAGGNAALTLGLIFCSTVLSPLATPAVFRGLGRVTSDLTGLDGLACCGDVSTLLTLFVLAPAVAGVLLRRLLGDAVVAHARPALKLLNIVLLLALTYLAASSSLPAVVARPNWQFLGVAVVGTLGMCAAGFASGAAVGRLLRADAAERAALMFGLGMSNNGTGLVVASTALAGLPEVMVAVICYNLFQHVTAAAVTRLAQRPAAVQFAPLPALVGPGSLLRAGAALDRVAVAP